MLVVAVQEERVAGEVGLWGWLCKQRSSLLCSFQQVREHVFSSCDQVKTQDASGQAGFVCCRGVRQLFASVCASVAPCVHQDPRAAESSCPFQDDLSFEIILLHDTAIKINLWLVLRCRSGRNFPLDRAAQWERNASFIPVHGLFLAELPPAVTCVRSV